ncbi:ThiF family adenylyltransferase [Pseudosulfitobacter sp. SM2401]|uniref:HesA/MoeB/ThiF family protein n=1 Tax=Pseudosulfitobacter sp. SM2401 TaxID=3350098 RepID=UPI0036F36D75
MSRYARQTAVLGAKAQQRLADARVLVIGAGGLAAPVLLYLVGAGVGHIRLMDADVVSLSNLHRQTLFRETDLGQHKTEVAARRLADLNSDVRIEAVSTRMDPSNIAAFCEGVDLVLDCADSFAVSYIASDHCLETGQPLISASVVGSDGYVGGFCGGKSGLRAVFPDLPGRLGSCDSDGVLGPSVGVIGSLQADMALAVLVGDRAPLGQLVTYDARSLRFGGFRFDSAPDPAPNPAFIAPCDIAAEDFLVDLRGSDEGGPPLPDAIRSTVAAFGAGGPTPTHHTRAVLACRSGLRAWQAAERLSQHWQGDIKLLALED